MFRYSLLLSGCLAVLLSCSKNRNEYQAENIQPLVHLAYATGFRIIPYKGEKLVEVPQPFQGATTGRSYLLVQRGHAAPEHDSSIPVIFVPIQRLVCTSTTQIPLLDYLGETDKLVGFPTTDYISSKDMRRRIDSGYVADLGVDKGMDLERLMALNPEMVMGYSISGDFGQFKKIESLGIPVVVNAEYLEAHPLGRAEWIKFMAAFFNKEQTADSVFRQIEARYKSIVSLTDTIKNRLTALSGILYGDAWFLPGGKNYAATLMDDAGLHYLWDEDPSQGFLQLDFEAVYQKAHDADFWIGVGSYSSLAQLGAAESRYKRFTAYQEGNVYTYDARKGAKGGSEFLELGYLRPDLVLQDLVKIANPNLLPASTSLFFYARLK